MIDSDDFRSMLTGGDRRSLGRSAEVLELIRDQLGRVPELVRLLWDLDTVVRMRAADVLEKLSRDEPACLLPCKAELLGLMAETPQQELRWHLALIAPRLDLTPAESRRAVLVLESYLEDRSSIVKTCAMQGLWELSQDDADMRAEMIQRIHEWTRTGTAAMRARSRKLLVDG